MKLLYISICIHEEENCSGIQVIPTQYAYSISYYTVWCTVHTVQRILYTILYYKYSVYCIIYTV